MSEIANGQKVDEDVMNFLPLHLSVLAYADKKCD